MKLNKIKETESIAITAKDQGEGFDTNPGDSANWMKSTKGMKERLAEYEG